MSDYIVIEEDRVKLALYTAGNLILTLVLMFICAEFMNRIFYLGVFLGATGIWFSVKYMFRYGKKLFAGTPVCEFKKKELVIHSLPGNAVTMQYSKIKEVKVLRDWKSVKIFIASSEVKHPSGWNYVGVIWPFRKSREKVGGAVIMQKIEVTKRIADTGAMAIVRVKTVERGFEIAQGCLDGGIDCLEISYTLPNAGEVIAALREKYGDKLVVGAGTVLDAETARHAILAGAQFIIAPNLSKEVAIVCNRYQIPYAPGCTSVTEVLSTVLHLSKHSRSLTSTVRRWYLYSRLRSRSCRSWLPAESLLTI